MSINTRSITSPRNYKLVGKGDSLSVWKWNSMMIKHIVVGLVTLVMNRWTIMTTIDNGDEKEELGTTMESKSHATESTKVNEPPCIFIIFFHK